MDGGPRVTPEDDLNIGEEAAPPFGLTVLSFHRGFPRDLCPYGAF
ncbi:hypothetical protein [Marivita sp.]|nr:hypothetical protein [Marivita sp.]